MNLRRSELWHTEIKTLGHIISPQGVAINPRKIEKVLRCETPLTTCGVRNFLNAMGNYRRFVRGFNQIAKLLSALLVEGQSFQWAEDCDSSFLKIKTGLGTTPILVASDGTVAFLLCTTVNSSHVC